MKQMTGWQKLYDIMMLPLVPIVMIWMLVSRRR